MLTPYVVKLLFYKNRMNPMDLPLRQAQDKLCSQRSFVIMSILIKIIGSSLAVKKNRSA